MESNNVSGTVHFASPARSFEHGVSWGRCAGEADGNLSSLHAVGFSFGSTTTNNDHDKANRGDYQWPGATRTQTPYPSHSSSTFQLTSPSPHSTSSQFKPVDTTSFRESPLVQANPLCLFGRGQQESRGGSTTNHSYLENVDPPPSSPPLFSWQCPTCMYTIHGLTPSFHCVRCSGNENANATMNDKVGTPYKTINGSNKRARVGRSPIFTRTALPGTPLRLSRNDSNVASSSSTTITSNNKVLDASASCNLDKAMGTKQGATTALTDKHPFNAYSVKSFEGSTSANRSGTNGLDRTPIPMRFSVKGNQGAASLVASTLLFSPEGKVSKKSKQSSGSKASATKHEVLKKRIELIEGTEKQKPPVAAGLSATGRPKSATKGTVARKPTLEKVLESQTYQLDRAAYDNCKLLEMLNQFKKSNTNKDEQLAGKDRQIATLQSHLIELQAHFKSNAANSAFRAVMEKLLGEKDLQIVTLQGQLTEMRSLVSESNCAIPSTTQTPRRKKKAKKVAAKHVQTGSATVETPARVTRSMSRSGR